MANPSILHSHRMVNKSMRCAAKTARNAEMRLRSAADDEAKSVNTSGDNLPAASSNPHAVVAAVGSRGALPRDIGDYELELIYSGDSDGETDSKEAKAKDELELAKPEPTKSASRSALSLADLRDIFGSSDESDDPSPRRSRSLESDRGGGKIQVNDDDGDSAMRHD